MHKDLGPIILRERIKLAGDFTEHLMLIHGLNKFQGIPLTNQILRGYNFRIYLNQKIPRIILF